MAGWSGSIREAWHDTGQRLAPGFRFMLLVALVVGAFVSLQTVFHARTIGTFAQFSLGLLCVLPSTVAGFAAVFILYFCNRTVGNDMEQAMRHQYGRSVRLSLSEEAGQLPRIVLLTLLVLSVPVLLVTFGLGRSWHQAVLNGLGQYWWCGVTVFLYTLATARNEPDPADARAD
ncbi:MAG: hypothetical protein H7338_15805 [Candidatus Sericytochromatia bacterium]|nr:hypothetical protein [Candidatus Sericytochromatia bacterium]